MAQSVRQQKQRLFHKLKENNNYVNEENNNNYMQINSCNNNNESPSLVADADFLWLCWR